MTNSGRTERSRCARAFDRWSARDLYRQVLRSREQTADCEAHAIGEAQCELALAEAICFSPRKGLLLAKAGVAAIPDNSDFKPRALRKLAMISRLQGKTRRRSGRNC